MAATVPPGVVENPVNEPRGTRITITPTRDFFMARDTMIRAWTGSDQEGSPVVALVAGLAKPGEPPDGLVPIPPPSPDWSPATRAAMARIWVIAEGLTAEEAEHLADIAVGLTAEDKRGRDALGLGLALLATGRAR